MECSSKRLLFMFLFIVVLMEFRGEGKLLLAKDFYKSTCPNVEKIVRQVVVTKMSQTFITVPGTLRLFFHDCFVTGCDASVLIFSQNNDAEKDAPDNLSLAGDGFDTVIQAKHAVESQCPGIVSCADILVIAARDVVALTGGPTWEVELGRRDGMISKASLVARNLPQPTFNLAQLDKLFAKNNLSRTDMIALSGAHTLGFSHCDRISDRLYSERDPTLNQSYARQLMQQCPKKVDPRIAVQMDPVTPQTFDNMYYKNLILRMGIFKSDDVLFSDRASNPTVMRFAQKPGDFAVAFVAGMTKLGRVGVKTGKQGQVRRDCASFNS